MTTTQTLTVIETVTEAIRSRRLLTFSYGGHERVVVPTTLGVHGATSNPVLRAYQVDGTSATRTVPCWEMYLLFKMRDVRIAGETFEDAPQGYDRDDSHMSSVLVHL